MIKRIVTGAIASALLSTSAVAQTAVPFRGTVERQCTLEVSREGTLVLDPVNVNTLSTRAAGGQEASVNVSATGDDFVLAMAEPEVYTTAPAAFAAQNVAASLRFDLNYEYTRKRSANNDADIQTAAGENELTIGLSGAIRDRAGKYPNGDYVAQVTVTCEPFDASAHVEATRARIAAAKALRKQNINLPFAERASLAPEHANLRSVLLQDPPRNPPSQ